jgi:hypothetical protein
MRVKQSAMQQQTRSYYLTTEQEKILVSLKKHGQYRVYSMIFGLFLMLWGFLVYFFPPNGTSDLYVFYLIFSVISVMHWKQLKQFQNDAPKLFHCEDVLVSGVLTKAVIIGRREDRKECIASLIPLLYRLNNRQAAEAFTVEHRQILRRIASQAYWRKHEPDLVAAAMVALVALEDSESKQVLKKLSGRAWKPSETWVGEAATICLKQWGTRWETPPKSTSG